MEQIIAKINELLKSKSQVVISIDGCAASGKTTLAEKLSETDRGAGGMGSTGVKS
jgi:deoxyadenosine/deoxycytidine kinase